MPIVTKKTNASEWLSTHPVSDKRVENIRQRMQDDGIALDN